MKLMLMHRLSAVSLLLLLGVFYGCAGMEHYPMQSDWYYVHKELPAADRAVEAARTAGKDRECPAEFQAADKMRRDAWDIYKACRTREAIAKANEATARANALCPKKAEAPIPAPVQVAPPPPVAVPEMAPVLAPKAEVKFILLEDEHFDFDKSTLTKEAEVILLRNIQVMKENPGIKVRIAGYASASGTEEYNQKLSERRAKTVEDYLIKEGGIAPERLTKIGYGETRPATYEPIPANINSKAAKSNMRVLFEVIVK
jgi:outer membrane protein OmpA-like peptidoglycan-associated protein